MEYADDNSELFHANDSRDSATFFVICLKSQFVNFMICALRIRIFMLNYLHVPMVLPIQFTLLYSYIFDRKVIFKSFQDHHAKYVGKWPSE